jgi:glycerophosphoryl diester phosphodiesterase
MSAVGTRASRVMGLLLPEPPDRKRTAFLKGWHYAHRGLHRGEAPLENSMVAMEEAIAGGYGIETDVRLSADGVAFVFHDQHLDRLTDRTGAFSSYRAEELDSITLRGGNGRIPRLSALLTLVGDRAPVLIEIKVDPGTVPALLCEVVQRELATVAHRAAIMSFDPRVSRWFGVHAPDIVRGLVITESGRRLTHNRVARHLAMHHARPDFLAYDIRDLPSRFATRARQMGFALMTWTVRGEVQESWARAYADAAIFEGRDTLFHG